MSEWDYGNNWGATYDPSYYYSDESTSWDYGNNWGATYDPSYYYADTNYLDSDAYKQFTGWGDPTGPGSSGDTDFTGEGSGLWNSILGGLGSVGSFLGKNSGTLGSLLTGAGSLGAAAIGSSAADEAARLQTDALNRGIDLQTAQWLQQQENLAPYLTAGRGGLEELERLAGTAQPEIPGATKALRVNDYALPSTTPGWTPQTYAGPTAPSADAYRYTPGTIPSASGYRYTPGALPTLSGKELLANDPGVQFRLDEGRKAVESSAAARGGLLSGPTLAALQRKGQDLSSQEYGAAWDRASEQAQLREDWALNASTTGWEQAEAESRLREQANQIASQQGWNQALAGQQNAFTQGIDTSKWNQEQLEQYATQEYDRLLAQSKYRYGEDVASEEKDYSRGQTGYKQRLTQYLLPWERQSTLANLGSSAVGMYGTQGSKAASSISDLLAQLGLAQGSGEYGSGLAWQKGVTGAVKEAPSLLAGLNA